jgi:hypothetical protein
VYCCATQCRKWRKRKRCGDDEEKGSDSPAVAPLKKRAQKEQREKITPQPYPPPLASWKNGSKKELSKKRKKMQLCFHLSLSL